MKTKRWLRELRKGLKDFLPNDALGWGVAALLLVFISAVIVLWIHIG